jgi:ribosomal protein S18
MVHRKGYIIHELEYSIHELGYKNTSLYRIYISIIYRILTRNIYSISS